MVSFYTRQIKDCMFDKVASVLDSDSVYDKYLSGVDEYMFDNVISPHFTKTGRAVLNITVDPDKNPMLAELFEINENRTNTLSYTLSSMLVLTRQSRLIGLSQTEEGAKKILETDILDQLVAKLRDSKEYPRITYRGAMYVVAMLSINPIIQA